MRVHWILSFGSMFPNWRTKSGFKIPLINRVLDEEGIDIPFPQWDLYLDQAHKKLIISGLSPYGFVNKIRLKIAKNYERDRSSLGTQPLRSQHLLS